MNHLQALTRFLDDGRIEIDNNAAERALRGVSLGRKNYLFLGSDAGGERAATMYSLLRTAKLNGINPEAYLRHVLTVIADHPVNRVDELLPWNVTLLPPLSDNYLGRSRSEEHTSALSSLKRISYAVCRLKTK